MTSAPTTKRMFEFQVMVSMHVISMEHRCDIIAIVCSGIVIRSVDVWVRLWCSHAERICTMFPRFITLLSIYYGCAHYGVHLIPSIWWMHREDRTKNPWNSNGTHRSHRFHLSACCIRLVFRLLFARRSDSIISRYFGMCEIDKPWLGEWCACEMSVGIIHILNMKKRNLHLL